jgi:hypothetical protein
MCHRASHPVETQNFASLQKILRLYDTIPKNNIFLSKNGKIRKLTKYYTFLEE